MKRLREKPPSKKICYVVLFGNRPLTGKTVGDETDIMCFTKLSKADDFIRGYKGYYHTTEPLSAIAVKPLFRSGTSRSVRTLY